VSSTVNNQGHPQQLLLLDIHGFASEKQVIVVQRRMASSSAAAAAATAATGDDQCALVVNRLSKYVAPLRVTVQVRVQQRHPVRLCSMFSFDLRLTLFFLFLFLVFFFFFA
jgi:hypothetical protein